MATSKLESLNVARSLSLDYSTANSPYHTTITTTRLSTATHHLNNKPYAATPVTRMQPMEASSEQCRSTNALRILLPMILTCFLHCMAAMDGIRAAYVSPSIIKARSFSIPDRCIVHFFWSRSVQGRQQERGGRRRRKEGREHEETDPFPFFVFMPQCISLHPSSTVVFFPNRTLGSVSLPILNRGLALNDMDSRRSRPYLAWES